MSRRQPKRVAAARQLLQMLVVLPATCTKLLLARLLRAVRLRNSSADRSTTVSFLSVVMPTKNPLQSFFIFTLFSCYSFSDFAVVILIQTFSVVVHCEWVVCVGLSVCMSVCAQVCAQVCVLVWDEGVRENVLRE